MSGLPPESGWLATMCVVLVSVKCGGNLVDRFHKLSMRQ